MCRSLMYCIFILLFSFLWLLNLFPYDCLHLCKWNRSEIVVVHSDIIFCRKKHTQPRSILSAIVPAGMNVSEKLPCVIVWAAIAEEWTVIQINLLLVDLDIHLHYNMLKVFHVILPQVLDVVVAGNKVYFPVQPVQYKSQGVDTVISPNGVWAISASYRYDLTIWHSSIKWASISPSRAHSIYFPDAKHNLYLTKACPPITVQCPCS